MFGTKRKFLELLRLDIFYYIVHVTRSTIYYNRIACNAVSVFFTYGVSQNLIWENL